MDSDIEMEMESDNDGEFDDDYDYYNTGKADCAFYRLHSRIDLTKQHTHTHKIAALGSLIGL